MLANTLDRNLEVAQRVARVAADSTHVVIAARGTSDNAARYAQYVWGTRNHLSVGLTTPSLFSLYDSPPRLTDALVVGISQSGQSPDIVAVLEEGRSQGRPTVALTNEVGSPLAQAADLVGDLCAGGERSVAATKTYTAQLALIALISDAMRQESSIADVVPAVQAMLDREQEAVEAAADFADMEHCAVLGRGFDQATAFEWALKIQELTHVVAQPFSTADFLHGPIAVLEPGYPVLAIAARGTVLEGVAAVLQRADAEGARIITISQRDTSLPGTRRLELPDGVTEWLSPIPAIVGAQLFSYHLTLAKGLDPDNPRGLQKVTQTT